MKTWKKIYDIEVSTTGEIRKNGKKITGSKNQKGYIRIKIKGKKVFAHKIIAIAFLGIPEDGQQVNHKNGKKDDNRVENLEWVTPSQNLKHSYEKLGRKASFQGKKMPKWICQKISNALKGKKRTKEQNKANSESHKGKGTLSKNPMAKRVVCKETGKIYGCIKEAAIDNKINPSSLGRSIKLKKKIKGLTFMEVKND